VAQALYPVEKLLGWVCMGAPPADEGLFQPRRIGMKLERVETAADGATQRLHLRMQLPWPGWGVLNVTGPVVGWSFAPEIDGVSSL
jgi:hypothetical protein